MHDTFHTTDFYTYFSYENTENAASTETKASLTNARPSTECRAMGDYQYSLEVLEETILLTLYLVSPTTILRHYFARMRILVRT